MSWRGIIVWVLGVLVGFQPVSASTPEYRKAFQLYNQGEFKKSRQLLQQVIGSKRSPNQLADAYKLRGIMEHLTGKKRQARASFDQALRRNPNLVITSAEAFDKTVIADFNKQKQSIKRRPRARAGKSASRSSITGSRKAASGVIFIRSNVPDARISINGIYAGDAFDRIDTNPGTIRVSVSAKGYRTISRRLRVFPNRENKYYLPLKALSRGSKRPASKQPVSKKKKRQDPDIFADDTLDRLPDGPRRSRRPAGSRSATGRQGAPYQPPPGYGQGGPRQGYPQSYQQGYSQGYAPQYPAGSQGYQQPLPPPYAPPQQAYPPPPYQAPQAYQQPEYRQPRVKKRKKPSYYGEKRKSRRKVKAKRTPKGSVFVAFMPFGIGQFQNGDYLLGTGFALIQLGGFYYYLDRNAEADKAISRAESFIAEQQQAGSADPAELQALKDDAETFAKQQRQNGDLGLYGSLLGWGLGATEAYVNMPTERKTKKRRSRRYSEMSTPVVEMLRIAQSSEHQTRSFGVGFVPSYHSPTKSTAVGLTAKLEF